jgi:phospholipid transport system substrate-binding protein
MKNRAAILVVLATWLIPACVWAETSPLAFVRENVERVVAVLENPDLRGEARRSQRYAELSRITDAFFNATELARRALGQRWRMLSEAEQQEFTQLFLELIKQTYLDKLDAYNHSGITYDQEILQSPTQAEVALTVATDKGPLRVEIALIQDTNGWRAFDVTVENISLVRNFRTQFQSILQSNPPQYLIRILKEKVHGSAQ